MLCLCSLLLFIGDDSNDSMNVSGDIHGLVTSPYLSCEHDDHIPRDSDGPLYAFSLFTPTIISQVGITVTLQRSLMIHPCHQLG